MAAEVPLLYLGTGGGSPGLATLGREGQAAPAAALEPGSSVYAVAVSPGAAHVAAGTRGRPPAETFGRVVVWKRQADGALGKQPVLACFQPTSVTALDFVTDEVAVSGGLDGQLLVWDVRSPARAAATIPAHQGPVWAVRSLSSSLLATLGADGFMRLWDLDRRSCTWQLPDPGGAPAFQGFLGLGFAPELNLLVSHYPSGAVLATEMPDGRPGKSSRLAVPPAGVVALAGERAVTADCHQLVLRAVPLRPGFSPREARVDRRVLAVVPVGFARVVVVFADGTASFWRLDPALEPEAVLPVRDVRSGSGPPRAFQLEEVKRKRAADGDALLARAREAALTGRIEDLQGQLDGLIAGGLGVEAFTLLAEACLKQGRTLWALRAQLALAASLPPDPWCAPHLYALADLLQTIREPERAREWFLKAAACDPGFRDAAARTAQLDGQRAASATPISVVRDDLGGTPDGARAEIEKLAILGESWRWRATLGLKETPLPVPRVELGALLAQLEARQPGWRRAAAALRARDGSVAEGEWLERDGAADGFPGLAFASLPSLAGPAPLLVHRVLLAAPPGGAPDEVAAALAPFLAAATEPPALRWAEALAAEVSAAAAFTGSRDGAEDLFSS